MMNLVFVYLFINISLRSKFEMSCTMKSHVPPGR